MGNEVGELLGRLFSNPSTLTLAGLCLENPLAAIAAIDEMARQTSDADKKKRLQSTKEALERYVASLASDDRKKDAR